MLGTTVAAIIKVTTKVDVCSYADKIVLTARMAEYKLEFAYSILSIIVVIRNIGLAIT